MKKLMFILSVLVLMGSTSSYAQRFAYVDTDYILERIPAYQQAQEKLDDLAREWRNEIDARYQEIDKMYKSYQAEQVLLTEQQKIERQEAIEAKERQVKEYQKQKFGYEGELFQKRQELTKPLQDDIYNEIQKIATEKSYDVIFDRSAVTMLYYKPKLDLSDDILKAMGFAEIKTQEQK